MSQMQYAKASDLKAYPSGANLQSIADPELDVLLTMASEWIDNKCGHGPNAFAASIANGNQSTQLFDGNGKQTMFIPYAVSISSITVDGSVLAGTSWVGYPSVTWRPFYRISLVTALSVYQLAQTALAYPGSQPSFTPGNQNVQITALWGYAANTPFGVKQACIMKAIEWLKEQGSSAFAMRGAGGGMNAGKDLRSGLTAESVLAPFIRREPL